jgi:uroporphyrinogen decarboxylase
MNSREVVIRTLNQQPVPRVARDLWIAPGLEAANAEAVAEIQLRFPGDIVAPEIVVPPVRRVPGRSLKSGEHADVWGCIWETPEQGGVPQLKFSPLAEGGKSAEYAMPMELLEPARFAKVGPSCAQTHRFVLAPTEVRPFDRLRFLRGESTLVELARGTKEIRNLLRMLHEFFCKELELWADTDVDGVVLRDDWGAADSLLIAPEMWREIFKPLYRDYCKILHAEDKFVFFRSSGNILDILGDLIKDGVDAVHADFHLTNAEKLAKRFRGRVTFWGDTDPQALRSGSIPALKESVLQTRRALDFGSGGVIAQCTWEPDVPLTAVAAVFEQWLVPLPMHG